MSASAISFIRFDFKHKEYQGIISEVKDNYFIMYDGLERLYVSAYNHSYEIGDIVKIKAKKEKIDFITLESEFDFNKYLNNKGIYYSLINTKIKLIFQNPIKLHKWRKDFLNRFSDESKSLIGAMMFSYNSYDSEVRQYAESLHLTRLISASGIYVYLFINTLVFILSYRLKEKTSRIIALAILSPYFLFTFPRFTIIKIVFIYIFRMINEYKLKKMFSNLAILSISGIFFLSLDRYLVFQDSFILGFLIPIALNYINYSFHHKKRIPKRIYSMIGLFFLFIPFEVKFFHEVAPLSMVYQIILSPLFMSFSFMGIISFIRIPIYPFMDKYSLFLRDILKFFSQINPRIYAPEMNDWLFLLYFTIFCLYFYLKEKKLLPIKHIVSLISSLLFIYYFSPIKYYVKEEVYFVNVGQGDCCILHKGEISIMIDTGGNVKKDIARDVLIPFLKNKQIYDLDLVITTHDDFDHSGALTSLKEHYPVKNYINNQNDFPMNIGNITINNYNYHFDENDENACSLVMSFHFANLDFVITGDAPIEVEKEIMANYSSIPCDILKVGHHGSNTSSCDEFIKYLSPREAIISCGRNNNYGHPHSEVISTLKRNNVKIKRTDLMGTITYSYYTL